MSGASIGLISDCPLQRHILQSAVENYGYSVLANSDPSRVDTDYLLRHGSVEVWIAILINEDMWDDLLGLLIDTADVPVLFGLSEAPAKHSNEYPKWERRLYSKIVETVGEPQPIEKPVELPTNINKELKPPSLKTIALPHHIKPALPSDPVERVVVLAASLGGPEAVKAFLDCLPAGIPAAFVYAQHIDQNAADVLLRVLGRHAAVELIKAKSGACLRNGEMMIMPVEREVSFDDDGKLVIHDRPWPGPYGPSIDQVMLNVANYYGSRTIVLVFSGMGNDGAIAGPLLKAYGGTIWAQTTDSCASSSMPDSVTETGCVEFRGDPAQLAEKLIRTIEIEILTKRKSFR